MNQREYEVRNAGESEWIVIPDFAREGVAHFFGTKTSCEPRWPKSGATVSTVRQVHGTGVALVGPGGSSRDDDRLGHDALITQQTRLAIGVSTADCVPVLLHDTMNAAVAAVHAGWRGTAAGILEATVLAMAKSFGTNPANLHMAIGPHIGGCCYRVGMDVWDAVASRHSYAQEIFRKEGLGDLFLILESLLERQAKDLGIREDHIWSTGLCTACQMDLFHSFRRDARLIAGMVSGVRLEG